MARNTFGFETASLIDAAGPHTVSPLASPFAAGIDGDLSTLLPPAPARRFRLLRDGVADINAIGHGLAARLIDLTEAGQRARQRLAQIAAQRVGESHPEHIAQTAALANAEEELARLNVRIASHEAIAGPRRALLAKVTDWLRSNAAGHDFAEVEIETPKLLKSETSPAMAIDRLRRRLRELNADEARILSAPYPLAVAAKIAEQFIGQRAVAPIASSLIEHAGPLTINGQHVEDAIVFPSKLVRAEVETVAGRGVSVGTHDDAVGLICWLMKKELTAAIVEELRNNDADEARALGFQERRDQLATVRADKEHVEREEAYLIWQAFAAGTVIEPRSDADPAAFLGVAVVEARARPTSFDHTEGIVQGRKAFGAAGSVPLFEPAVHPSQDADPGSPPS